MLHSRYIHVLHLLSTIPAKAINLNPPTITEAQANRSWDHMFTYIHAYWPMPESANHATESFTESMRYEAMNCAEMLFKDEYDLLEKLATLPPYFNKYVFPVSVARYMLRDLRMPIDHRKLKTFDEFHRRYGSMIIWYGLQ